MAMKFAKSLADLRMPHEWWESARKMTRNIHFHTGPTNSGKTYQGLSKLMSSKTGVYCAPLRLLAAEVHEKMTKAGIKCSLITGQDINIVPNATHVSCTIESVKFDKKYDCALIDEVQMISDFERGAAWTNAILGLLSPEIHITGELRAKQIIKNLVDKTKDCYIEYNYDRLSQLFISPPVMNINELQQGDCLIAFSRRKCHALKNYIEKTQPGSCAIIYGSLPPDVRKDQALKFNSNQVKYLIATDAVGMGLNYSIDRIVFMETQKRDARRKRHLFPHEIKQISGRAGRYKKQGFVTACDLKDYNEISIGLSHNQDFIINKAGLTPSYEQIKDFSDNFAAEDDKITYSKLLIKFSRIAKLENIYFFQSIEEACRIAKLIENLGLDFEDIHKFSNTSIRMLSKDDFNILVGYAEDYLHKKEVKFKHFDNLEGATLDTLEKYNSFCENYLSLAAKFDKLTFPETDEVRRFIGELSLKILDQLNQTDTTIIESKLSNDLDYY